jgi:hypothetical protein
MPGRGVARWSCSRSLRPHRRHHARVVLLAVNRLAVAVRLALQARTLLLRDDAVGLRAGLVGVQLRLAGLEVRGLGRCELTELDSLIDPLLLADLALAEVRDLGALREPGSLPS